MRFYDKNKAVGFYDVIYKDLQGNVLKKERYYNVICQTYYNNLFSLMTAGTGSITAETFRTGDGTNTANRNDLALQNQLFSKNITVFNYTANSVILRTVLAPQDSNFIIKEIGIFSDLGQIISRVNTNIDKNASTQIDIFYTILFN
jgi:hypothetical protein